MKYFGITDKGKVRNENQDCYILERVEPKKCTLLVLCDGLGSSKAGGVASDISSRSFINDIKAKLTSRLSQQHDYKKILTDACISANDLTFEYSLFDDSFKGFGTTMVGGVLRDDGKIFLINVGDSRAYIINRRGKGSVRQITTDNSLVEDLVESGVITREQARNHPQKNVITRAVGSEPSIEADYYEAELKNGEMLMLCSDGLSNLVSDEEMLDYFSLFKQPEDFCNALLDLTYERGAKDNVTIISVVR